MGVVAATSRTAVGRVPALGGAAVVGAGVATACAQRALGLAAGAGTAGVDDLVELLVVTVGAVVLAWLAGSAAVAATCLVARSTGRRWRAGEALVRRFAPTVVRRALVVVVAAGIGAATVTTASAAEPTPSSGAVAVSAATPGDDLGWVVTAPGATTKPGTTPAPGATGTPAPAPSDPPARWATPAPAGAVGGPGTGPTALPEVGGGTPSRDAGVVSPAAAATRTTTPTPTPTPTPSVPSPATPDPSPSTTAPQAAPSPAATERDDVPPGRAAPPAPPVGLPAPEAPPATVVVARGDTLWGIAARHLPPGAGDARIAAAWPAWYAANAATIGPDPGLIRPGQVLVVPAETAR